MSINEYQYDPTYVQYTPIRTLSFILKKKKKNYI